MKAPCDESAVTGSTVATVPCREEAGPWILTATILASSMAFIDSTVVNVALPALQHSLGVHAGLDQFQRDFAFDRFGLLGDPDFAHAAFADVFNQRVPPGDDRAGLVIR